MIFNLKNAVKTVAKGANARKINAFLGLSLIVSIASRKNLVGRIK